MAGIEDSLVKFMIQSKTLWHTEFCLFARSYGEVAFLSGPTRSKLIQAFSSRSGTSWERRKPQNPLESGFTLSAPSLLLDLETFQEVRSPPRRGDRGRALSVGEAAAFGEFEILACREGERLGGGITSALVARKPALEGCGDNKSDVESLS